VITRSPQRSDTRVSSWTALQTPAYVLYFPPATPASLRNQQCRLAGIPQKAMGRCQWWGISCSKSGSGPGFSAARAPRALVAFPTACSSVLPRTLTHLVSTPRHASTQQRLPARDAPHACGYPDACPVLATYLIAACGRRAAATGGCQCWFHSVATPHLPYTHLDHSVICVCLWSIWLLDGLFAARADDVARVMGRRCYYHACISSVSVPHGGPPPC